MQYFIIGNFGNHSLATMQFLIEKGIDELHFIYVDTGWTQKSWVQRVHDCSIYARKMGIVVHLLSARPDFSALVKDRQEFPSPKFQWCASFLKGLPILNCLDELDPACEAQIVLSKRRLDSKRYEELEEFDAGNELYQGRTLWHPLWQTEDDALRALIQRAGFELLNQPSLECSPCIHSQGVSLADLCSSSIERLEALENSIGKTMYAAPIRSFCTASNSNYPQNGLTLQRFDLGCGTSWGCGE